MKNITKYSCKISILEFHFTILDLSKFDGIVLLIVWGGSFGSETAWVAWVRFEEGASDLSPTGDWIWMSKRSGICRIICNSTPTLMHTAASTILHSRWAQEHSKRCRIYYPHTWVLLDYKRYLSGTIRLLAGTLSPRSVLLCSRNRCRAKRCCSEFSLSIFTFVFPSRLDLLTSLKLYCYYYLWFMP